MVCCKVTYKNNDFKYIYYNGITEIDNLKLLVLSVMLISEYPGKISTIQELKIVTIPELENIKEIL